MTPEIVERDAFELAGIETRASNDHPEPIGALWERFARDEVIRRLDPVDDGIVAVYCDYEGDHTNPYTFFLGRRVAPEADLPPGLVRRRIEAGRFARFLAQGEQPAALIGTWQAIWGARLERRYDHDYELHSPEDPSRVEIYVGV